MSISDWLDFVSRLPAESPTRGVIVESWARCRAAALARHDAVEFSRVEDADLQQRLVRNDALMRAAKPHLDWLTSTYGWIRHVAYITDVDAIVLCAVGDAEFQRNLGLAPGYDWSEKTMGTNGAGTAIAADRPVAVVGSEHYLSAFENCTCTAAPIHDAQGVVIGAIDFSTSAADGVPERLPLIAHVAFMIERELRHDHELREKDAYRTLSEQLGVQQKKLEEADRRKDEFIAVISHELRNPLAPIKYGVHVIQTVAPEHPALRKASEVITRQVDYLTRLLNDLLDVSRIVHGRIDLQRERTDLGAAVNAAAESVQPFIDARKQHLDAIVPAAKVYVSGDSVRLVQVVLNLLHNASKFTPEKGRITVELTEDTRAAVLVVRDTGAGMTETVLRQLFEPFMQAGAPGGGGGLGVGLYLVKKLVELHGGTVTATSRGPGKGSEFTVRLPVLPEDAAVATSG